MPCLMDLPIRRRAVCFLLVLLLAGCGGSGKADPPGEGPTEPPFDPPVGDDVRLDTTPGGTALSVFPQICADGDSLYVVWYDRRDGDTDVYANRSRDGGATWLMRDVRLDTDDPGAASSNLPRICCDGDRVYVAWADLRSGPSEIRFSRSLDAGSTWLTDDVRLDRDAPQTGISRDADVCCDGNRVYVVWQDLRNGAWDVYFNRSLDAGATWLVDDVRLDTDVAGASGSEVPRIACDGNAVWVVWQDDRDGGYDVRLNRSDDGGDTWLDADVRLDSGFAGDADSLQPRIAVASPYVYVAWPDDRDGNFDVHLNRSGDRGATWRADDVRLDSGPPGAADSERVTLAACGSQVFVAWEDARAGSTDVHLNRSLDGGLSFLPADVRLETIGPGVARSFSPQVACSPTHVFVTWYDDRSGAFDVLLQTSRDAGETWRAKDIRLDTDAPGAASSLAPRLVVRDATARVVWYDTRDGPGDIYANRASAGP